MLVSLALDFHSFSSDALISYCSMWSGSQLWGGCASWSICCGCHPQCGALAVQVYRELRVHSTWRCEAAAELLLLHLDVCGAALLVVLHWHYLASGIALALFWRGTAQRHHS